MALDRLAHKSGKTGYTVIIYNWRIFSTSTGVLHMYNEYTNITMCPPQPPISSFILHILKTTKGIGYSINQFFTVAITYLVFDLPVK